MGERAEEFSSILSPLVTHMHVHVEEGEGGGKKEEEVEKEEAPRQKMILPTCEWEGEENGGGEEEERWCKEREE